MTTLDTPAQKELAAIKKLLILALVNSGVKLDAIGSALGVDATNVSRMFKKGTFAKKVTKRG